MAHPLITIQSGGSSKRDSSDINLSTSIAKAPISADTRTSASKTHSHHTLTATESIYHHNRHDNSPLPHSQTTSSSPTAPGTSEAQAEAEAIESADIPVWRLVNIVLAVAGVSFLTNFSAGLITIGIPQTALDIGLQENLVIWPVSVYSLASGSCLLLAGSIADVVGNRGINLLGCFLVGCFMTACGLAQTGIQLIMFRALQGIAVALCLPTSVAIISHAAPTGRKRNISFSILGFVQPAGFSAGLILSGVMLDTIGWRCGYYISGGLTLLLFVVSIWILPADQRSGKQVTLTRLQNEVDWVAGIASCACLSMFSYLLAELTNNLSNITRPGNIVMLVICVGLVPFFVLWEQRQERLEKPTLMPNSLWRNTVFTNICVVVLFAWAVLNMMEMYCSLFFQNVQGLSATQSSLRILPTEIIGSLCQLSTGLLIHRISAFYLVIGSMLLSAGAPLLMALINVQWPYWYNAFFAQLLAPLSADILFTVALLVISDVFPPHTQALAGAVFNTVSQFGESLGLTVIAVVSSTATKHAISSSSGDIPSPAALMVGYRAGFWAAFAFMMFGFSIGVFGLRGIGKVGVKRD